MKRTRTRAGCVPHCLWRKRFWHCGGAPHGTRRGRGVRPYDVDGAYVVGSPASCKRAGVYVDACGAIACLCGRSSLPRRGSCCARGRGRRGSVRRLSRPFRLRAPALRPTRRASGAPCVRRHYHARRAEFGGNWVVTAGRCHNASEHVPARQWLPASLSTCPRAGSRATAVLSYPSAVPPRLPGSTTKVRRRAICAARAPRAPYCWPSRASRGSLGCSASARARAHTSSSGCARARSQPCARGTASDAASSRLLTLTPHATSLLTAARHISPARRNHGHD